MAKSTTEGRTPSQDARPRAMRAWRENRDASEVARPNPKPVRRRVNEITNSIGLTPITGRSGPRIAY